MLFKILDFITKTPERAAITFGAWYLFLWLSLIMPYGWWPALNTILIIHFVSTTVIAYPLLKTHHYIAASAVGIFTYGIMVVIAATDITPLIQFPVQQ